MAIEELAKDEYCNLKFLYKRKIESKEMNSNERSDSSKPFEGNWNPFFDNESINCDKMKDDLRSRERGNNIG